jgi:hypothetical protein
MWTRFRARSAEYAASVLFWPSRVKLSISWRPTRSDGFSACPGSWYTIDASRARNWRSWAVSIDVMSLPLTRTCPPVMAPLRGR